MKILILVETCEPQSANGAEQICFIPSYLSANKIQIPPLNAKSGSNLFYCSEQESL